jgi:hypothetical protein
MRDMGLIEHFQPENKKATVFKIAQERKGFKRKINLDNPTQNE